MAASAISKLSLFLVVSSLFSSCHIQARSVEMFNKFPSQTNDVIVNSNNNNIIPQNDNFIPQNGNNNNYGLYGQESGQTTTNAAAATTINSNFPYSAKYLPKNYNTKAYVTQPEDFPDTTATAFATGENTNNYFYNGEQNGVTEAEFEKLNKYFDNGVNKDNNGLGKTNLMDTPSTATATATGENINNYYNGEQNGVTEAEFEKLEKYFDNGIESFNSGNKYYDNGVKKGNNGGLGETKLIGTSSTTTTTANNGGDVNSFQRQGLSDTRFLDNGKYYYDVNSQKNTRNPYENLYNDNEDGDLFQKNNFGEEPQVFNGDVNWP